MLWSQGQCWEVMHLEASYLARQSSYVSVWPLCGYSSIKFSLERTSLVWVHRLWFCFGLFLSSACQYVCPEEHAVQLRCVQSQFLSWFGLKGFASPFRREDSLLPPAPPRWAALGCAHCVLKGQAAAFVNWRCDMSLLQEESKSSHL